MMNICQMGFACPHMGRDEDGFTICLHPHTPETFGETDVACYPEDIDCPLVDLDSELADLLTMVQGRFQRRRREPMKGLVAFVTPDGVHVMTTEEFDALPVYRIPGSEMSDTRGRPTLYVEPYGVGQAYPAELSEGVRG